MIRFPEVKVIAFDADDTLWENETRFRAAESQVGEVLKEYCDLGTMSRELYSIELKNMPDYGYGAKAFTLSMLENAVKISGGRLTGEQTGRIIEIGRELLHNPATPLEGVRETLSRLRDSGRYRLAVLTKGDLLDQEHKLSRSGLSEYFDFVEIVSDKSTKEYSSLLEHLGAGISEFMMVGNSFKSDIAPVLELGGYGAHIPFHVTWELEKVEEYDHPHLFRVASFSELLGSLL